MVGNSLPETPIPAKRGRGRPRKSELAAKQGDEASVTPKSEPKQKRPRKKKTDLPPPVLDGGYVGQSVSGVIDGSFEAGYFLTVRIGETDAVLRGVIFGPGFSMPLSLPQKAAVVVPNEVPEGNGFSPLEPLAAEPSTSVTPPPIEGPPQQEPFIASDAMDFEISKDKS